MIDPDEFFTDPENWDDGDRAYDKYVDMLALLADERDVEDRYWDFDPYEGNPDYEDSEF